MNNIKASAHQLILLPVIVCWLFITCQAQTRPPKELAAKADNYMKALVNLDRFSGSILIARDGQILFSKGYGMANIEQNTPNAPQTKFRLGSISKQFNAMTIMILQERGKLNVQDSVCKYVPDCPAAWQTVVIQQLLTHTSGIPSYTDFPDNDEYERKQMTPAATIERFKNKPLRFNPGEKFSYSNSGYALLGYIVERVSGKSYEEFLRENILEPLRMSDSGYDHPSTILMHRAAGYARRGGELINAPYLEMDTPYSGGALYSTVEDLYLWSKALETEKLVSQKSLEAIFTPYTPAVFYWHGYVKYGYGWRIAQMFNRKLIFHTGHINGFIDYIGRYPDDRVSIIILSNREDASVRRASRDLAAIVFGQKYETPRKPIKLNSQIYDAYLGKYQFPDGKTFDVERDGDKLWLVLAPNVKFELFPQSETEFEIFTGEVDSQVVFVKDAKGQVTHLLADWDTQVKKIK